MAWVENSFPALEVLHLVSNYNLTVLSNGFLMGGSDGAPRRLREIRVSNVSFPHCLLRSSRDLVSLYLDHDPVGGVGSLSAEALAAVLSETYQLEGLTVKSDPTTPFYPDQRRANPSSPINTCADLRALSRFGSQSSEYLEGLVSRVDAPILGELDVSLFEHVSNVPRLSQFVSRTKHLNSLPHRTTIGFSATTVTIQHQFRQLELPPPRKVFSLTLSMGERCAASNWIASQVLHICGQFSGYTSSVEKLRIRIQIISADYEGDTDRWLQLLGGFRSMEDLHLFWWRWHRVPAVCTAHGACSRRVH